MIGLALSAGVFAVAAILLRNSDPGEVVATSPNSSSTATSTTAPPLDAGNPAPSVDDAPESGTDDGTVTVLPDGTTYHPDWAANVELSCGPGADTRVVDSFEAETAGYGIAELYEWERASGRAEQLQIGAIHSTDKELQWRIGSVLLGPWAVGTVVDWCTDGQEPLVVTAEPPGPMKVEEFPEHDPEELITELPDGSTFDPKWTAAVVLGCVDDETWIVEDFVVETAGYGEAFLYVGWPQAGGIAFDALELGAEVPDGSVLYWSIRNVATGPWEVVDKTVDC
ncbi:MAG: hypothetical protein GY708_01220 [Actinomycetia bacterium]|nr:hypothetical protein [Actinomycetes bacterium]MCP4963544.1 hypothetical protein [Actinomycetes bacterium]